MNFAPSASYAVELVFFSMCPPLVMPLKVHEQSFRRDKVRNYFSIMLKKRLKKEEDDGDGEQTGDKASKHQSVNEFVSPLQNCLPEYRPFSTKCVNWE